MISTTWRLANRKTVSFTFQVDDGRGSTDTATVDGVVTGSNDGPTAVALSGNNVTENLTGMVVGTLATTDIDSTDTHDYAVSDARFEVGQQRAEAGRWCFARF